MDIIALYIGLATVLGSIIGTFISTLLGRFQKVSAFRQEWINSLRLTFAQILLQCEKYTDVAHQNNEEAYRERIELVREISKVKLFLNLKEDLSRSLVQKIENIPYDYLGKNGGAREFGKVKPEIERVMQDILKEEWNRVRDGEFIWKLKKIVKIKPLMALNTYPRWQGIVLLVALLILTGQLLFAVM